MVNHIFEDIRRKKTPTKSLPCPFILEFVNKRHLRVYIYIHTEQTEVKGHG